MRRTLQTLGSSTARCGVEGSEPAPRTGEPGCGRVEPVLSGSCAISKQKCIVTFGTGMYG